MDENKRILRSRLTLKNSESKTYSNSDKENISCNLESKIKVSPEKESNSIEEENCKSNTNVTVTRNVSLDIITANHNYGSLDIKESEEKDNDKAQENRSIGSVMKNNLEKSEIDIDKKELEFVRKVLCIAETNCRTADEDNFKNDIENSKNNCSINLDRNNSSGKEIVDSKKEKNASLNSETVIKRKTKRAVFQCPKKNVKQGTAESSKKLLESKKEKQTEMCNELQQVLSKEKSDTVEQVTDESFIKIFPELKIEEETKECDEVEQILNETKNSSVEQVTDESSFQKFSEGKTEQILNEKEGNPNEQVTDESSLKKKSGTKAKEKTEVCNELEQTFNENKGNAVEQGTEESSINIILESKTEEKAKKCDDFKQIFTEKEDVAVEKEKNIVDGAKFSENEKVKEKYICDVQVQLSNEIKLNDTRNEDKVGSHESKMLSGTKDKIKPNDAKKESVSSSCSEKFSESKKKMKRKLRDGCYQVSDEMKQNKIRKRVTSQDPQKVSKIKSEVERKKNKPSIDIKNSIKNEKDKLRKQTKNPIKDGKMHKKENKKCAIYADDYKSNKYGQNSHYYSSNIFEVVVPLIGKSKFIFNDDDKPFARRYDLAIERNRLRGLHDKKMNQLSKIGRLKRWEIEANKSEKEKRRDALKKKMENLKLARDMTVICIRMLKILKKEKIDQKQLARYLMRFLHAAVTPTSLLYVPHFIHTLGFCRGHKNFNCVLRVLAELCYRKCHAMFPIPCGYNFETVYTSEVKKFTPRVYERFKHIVLDYGDASDILGDLD